MKWITELMWLWKALGIAFLSAAVGVALVWGVCKASGKPTNKVAAVIAAVAAFAISILVILLLSQTPAVI